jgi:LysR family transcriptional regulator, benzoate and cis,cis-muconate-responsive activator of ben and cat genes
MGPFRPAGVMSSEGVAASNTFFHALNSTSVWGHATVDLRQLRYFVAVAEERNFGRAAARLHVSQPPITRQIKLLEDELGTPVFNRMSWGVELTPAGEALLPRAQEIAALVGYATDLAQRVGAGNVGRLEVGIFGSGALSIVPAILKRYSRRYPEVEIGLFNAPQYSQIQALRQRRILITFDRYLPDDSDLIVEVVARERLFVAVHESNPLARKARVAFEELKGEPMMMARDARHADWLRMLCHDNGFEPTVSQRAGDVVSGLTFVAKGFGVEVVPESVRVLQLPGLTYRRLHSVAGPHAHLDLQCAYRRGDMSPLLSGVLEAVHSYSGIAGRPR